MRAIRRSLVLLAALACARTAVAATTFTGRTLDAGTAAAIAGVSVDVEIGLTARPGAATSDPSGLFSIVLDGWPAEDLAVGRALLTLKHPNYAGLRQQVTFRIGETPAPAEFRLAKPGGGALRASLRDSLNRMRDATGRTLAFADFDLDASGVTVNGDLLQNRLMRRLELCVRTYLQERGLPDDLCQLPVVRLPAGIDMLDENVAREAGGIVNALALIGGELRIRPAQPAPTLQITTKFLPMPRADSLLLSGQTVEDKLALDPREPSSITGNAGLAWALQTGIAIGIREARDGMLAHDRARLSKARDVLLAVQGSLPAADGPLYHWIEKAIDMLARRIDK